MTDFFAVESIPDQLFRADAVRHRRSRIGRDIDAEKVVSVALNPDDELRNLQVVLLYSLTSRRLDHRLFPVDDRLPDEPTNANWFTMAQWAVLTVGRNMRTRDLPNRVSMLPGSVRRRVTPAVLWLRASDDRRIAAALSFGQIMVLVSTYHALLAHPDLAWDPGMDPEDVPVDQDTYPDDVDLVDVEDHPGIDGSAVQSVAATGLSAETERLLDEMVTRDAEAHAQAEADAVTAWKHRRDRVVQLARQLGATFKDAHGKDILPELEDVEPSVFYRHVLEQLAHRAGHQDELAYAFSLYAAAGPQAQADARLAHELDPEVELPRSPADLVFEANLRLAAIEQIILDEAVTMVINHVPQHLTHQLEGRLALFAERSLRVPRRIAQVNASRRIAMAAEIASDLWARVMTDQVLVIALPSETIRLGRDLPCRDWRKPFYADALTTLSASAQALFDAYDRSLGDGRGAGAGDWRRWDDRLNFVANLMRSRHDDASLFWRPFTGEDEDRIWRSRYPSRVADPFEQAVRSPWFPEELGTDLHGITYLCDGPGR